MLLRADQRRRLHVIRSVLLILMPVWLLTACQPMPKVTIAVGHVNVLVEVATTEEQRQRGLMYRHRLGLDEGLLMVFPEPQEVSLWMLNTWIPLDVGFFDRQGRLLTVLSMQPDGGQTLHHSPPDTRYALEMNQGWFSRYRLEPGAFLDVEGLQLRIR